MTRRYAAERDKRLRPDGPDQYQRLTGRFAHYLTDPYTPRAERPPVSDHVTFAFIGGGFAGLLAGARLREAGVADVRIVDKAGDFGGTWYWNRYPGAMCDTASMVYMPLLEETGHMPSEKYAHGPEILAHCRRIGERFGLYQRALFHTEVTTLCWDDERRLWRVGTDRGDDFTARFVGMGTGPLHVPKLPGVAGIDRFAGHSFHTSRWDYDYTGGDACGAPMDGLAHRRVAVIGTGATAVQCVPELARAAGELYVFQRTPSAVDRRENGPLDPGWFASLEPGWQQEWLDNFTANWEAMVSLDRPAPADLVADGWTDLARRVRTALAAVPAGERTLETLAAAYEEADFAKMDQIRARVDEVVTDPDTAAALKAWYRQLCKRPCFHDGYLDAFNQANVHLVDTDGRGVEAVTATGVVARGRHYELDCIVYASGFEVNTDYTRRCGFDPVGRGGRRLSGHWAGGMRTLHGLQVHGFPNLFLSQLAQGAFLASNVPHNLVEAARSIAEVVVHAASTGATRVEPAREAEDAWVRDLLDHGRTMARPDCTPGYYNNEGQPPSLKERHNVGYPLGPSAYFAHMRAWRAGGFDGLVFD